jgi:hypothetical protein
MTLEVRCCCRPNKLLGWIDTPLPVSPGAWITFWVPPIARGVGTTGIEIEAGFRVALPVEWIILPGGMRHLALKSEETPIETLRRIQGFREHEGD